MTIDFNAPDLPFTKPLTIRELFGNALKRGEVGLELEFEGRFLPKKDKMDNPWGEYHPDDIPSTWDYCHDGSLRGMENAEYVLKSPIAFDKVDKELDKLWEMFKERGSVLDESNRTSVHVHLNAQEWYINRVISFFGLWFCVEDVLTNWCGPHRVGNLFCLRGRDISELPELMKTFSKSDGDCYLDASFHYAGINCHSLAKFGSIEIRTMRGVSDPQLVKDWVSILKRLYDLSEEYPDPRQVISSFSGSGPESFLRNILGEFTDKVIEECGMTEDEINESVYAGVRIAQDICYCREWESFKLVEVNKDDPFGRTEGAIIESHNLYQGGIMESSIIQDFIAQMNLPE